MKDQILKLRSEGKTYQEISKIVGCSSGTISYHCGKGVKEKAQAYQRAVRNGTYIPKPPKQIRHCRHCGDTIKSKHLKQKFCDNKCQQSYNYQLNIKNWKDGKHQGWSGRTIQLAAFIRRYLFEKYQHACCKCGWNKVHSITGKSPLEVNHIDGNAKNCKEENLELICPNCHSLTYNFRALNKNSPRKRL